MIALPGEYEAWGWQEGSDPLTLTRDTRPLPSPAAGEVLVQNHAIGLNPVDWKVLGAMDSWAPGHVAGVDGAGVVVALGEGVTTGWLGQRVAYHQNLLVHGSYAEFTPVRAEVLLRLPEAMDFATAAGLPCPLLTAWTALDQLPSRPGEAMLVSGAGGAVGGYIVQLATRAGWRVTAMCNARHRERLAGLGAVDWIAGPLPDDTMWSDPRRFSAVIDSIGPDHAMRLHPAVRAKGHLVCIQGRVAQWPSPAFGRALSLHEIALGALHQHGDSEDWARVVTHGEVLLSDIAAGRIVAEPLVSASFADLPQALAGLRDRNFTGKPIVLLDGKASQ
ncbi:alcohol dehydrogenase catalytic domain-containing protein [Novosphingobium sp. 9]|uniref:alcohol dehydrogenase catalytic domain-containing protein n=1 Tax=Novosphingobium sp. 9 TaxID=2025349 RepID=UPI0021B6B93B|nr:alcohol dehydrogenase catalytic domain-containing protein [Novosphingobium sp. 9]